jgi:Flp pilus assembly protein TadD
MRICSVAVFVWTLWIPVGCTTLTLSPTATPMRLQAYNDAIAERYVTANDFERQGQYEQARQIYQELHLKHPKNPDYLHRLAVVNTRLRRIGEATSFYERARQASPKNVRLLADMGYAEYLKGDLPKAEQILREALSVKPTDRRVINNLALVLAARGEMNECESLLKKIGSEPDALGSLAYIHATLGDSHRAEARFRDALKLDPQNAYAMKGLAELSSRNLQTASIEPLDRPAFEPIETPKSDATKVPVIQQASAVTERGAQEVVTADFLQDSATPAARKFDEDPDFSEPSKSRVTPAAFFEENDPAELEPTQNQPAEPAAVAQETIEHETVEHESTEPPSDDSSWDKEEPRASLSEEQDSEQDDWDQ